MGSDGFCDACLRPIVLPNSPVHAARLYVGELPPDVRESELETIFGKFGRLASVGERLHCSFPFLCAHLDFGRSPLPPLLCKPSP
jgi:hypothetical protein